MKRQINVEEVGRLVRQYSQEKKLLRQLEEERLQRNEPDPETEKAISYQTEVVKSLHRRILRIQTYYGELQSDLKRKPSRCPY